MSQINPFCQDGCDVFLPVFDFSDCNPDVNRGQIDRIYFRSPGGAPFADWTQLAEWTADLDNTNVVSLDKIRFLNVIGEKPAAEGDVKEISRIRKVIMDKNHTVNFTVDETNHINYEALRALECGGNFDVWYQSGKYLYGGNDGIQAFIKLNQVIPKDRKELETYEGVLTWEASHHPEQCLNPMA